MLVAKSQDRKLIYMHHRIMHLQWHLQARWHCIIIHSSLVCVQAKYTDLITSLEQHVVMCQIVYFQHSEA